MGEQEKPGMTPVLMLAVFAAVFGGTFPYGYNIAVVNAPAIIIQTYFFGNDEVGNTTSGTNDSMSSTTPSYLENGLNSTDGVNEENLVSDADQIKLSDSELFMWSLTVSIYTVGGMTGSYLTSVFIKRLGRKGSILAMNGFAIVGAILAGASKAANSIEMIIVARFLLGILAGLGTGVVPLYIGEISPRHLRGALGVVSQLFITLGILGAQILSLEEVLGSEELWPVLLAFTCAPSIVQLCILPFLPESPRCLLIDRDREDLAKAALIRFRGTKNVSQEMQEMREEAAAEEAASQMSVLELLKDKSVRWQLISIVVMQITQQLSGINAVFFYLNTILNAAGVPVEMQNYASVGIGAVNTFMTIVSVMLMDRAGRKSLLAVGYGIAASACVLMTVSLLLQSQVAWMSTMSIVCVVLFIIGFAIGPGPVPWILTAELFRQSARPAASAIGCGVNWTANFILALVFPFMQKAMGPYVFLFFLCVCVVACAFVVVVLPETKNKTFQEISVMFAKRNKVKVVEIEMDEEKTHIVKRK